MPNLGHQPFIPQRFYGFGNGILPGEWMPPAATLQTIWADALGLPSGLNCAKMGGVTDLICGGYSPIMDAESANTGQPQPPTLWQTLFHPDKRICKRLKILGKADLATGAGLMALGVVAPVTAPVAEPAGLGTLLGGSVTELYAEIVCE